MVKRRIFTEGCWPFNRTDALTKQPERMPNRCLPLLGGREVCSAYLIGNIQSMDVAGSRIRRLALTHLLRALNDEALRSSGGIPEPVGLQPRPKFRRRGAIVLRASCICALWMGFSGCRNDSPPDMLPASQSSGEPRGQDVVRELQQAVEAGARARAERLATQAMMLAPTIPTSWPTRQ